MHDKDADSPESGVEPIAASASEPASGEAESRDSDLMREPETEAALVRMTVRPSQPNGGVNHYQVNRTLPISVELARQLRRGRTQLVLGFLAALPILLLLAFEVGGDGDASGATTLVDLATSSGLNFAVFTLFVSTGFLVTVMVALFFGDTVASEASWASLKYLLAAPIPRSRLLRQKTIVAALLSAAGLGLLTLFALVAGLCWYGFGELISPTGEALPFSAGLISVLGAVVYLAVHLMWVAGLALLFGVRTDAPLGAVGGAVLVSILSGILDQITVLGELRIYLPTHYSRAWSELLTNEVEWTALANGAFSGLAYAAVFTGLAVLHFRRKDITS